MIVRERLEQAEFANLSEYACKSAASRGREREIEKCALRTDFQRDKDRIIHCKAFRRLMYKTQVFIYPEGDHYRTRLTHTLEVQQVSRTIARALRLNEDLTEAIALGHDLGHTPYGHTGEDALDAIMREVTGGGFSHNEQSVRVVKFIENEGSGLNLTYETIDGIKNHRTSGSPATLEGAVVRLSDKIAYINHDIDDALRAGILTREQIPKECTDVLGLERGERIDALVSSVVRNSMDKPAVSMEPEAADAANTLRAFLFENVYFSPRQLEERAKIGHMFEELFMYYMKNTAGLPAEFLRHAERDEPIERVICDYIAGMTDRFILREFTGIFMPIEVRG